MLSNLKPVPRYTIIALIVAGIGYGLMKVDFAGAAKKLNPQPPAVAAEPAPQVTTVTPPAQAPAPAAPADPKAAADAATTAAVQAAQPAPGLQPATSNAGIDAVLRAKK